MAWHLFRLGRWSFRHRRLVATAWVGLLVAMAVGAVTLSGTTSDTFELKGVESTKAFALIKERSPQATTDGATAQVVFRAPAGETLSSAANKKAVADALSTATTRDVATVVSPFDAGAVSKDGTVGYATITYSKPAVDLTAADTGALEDAKAQAGDTGLVVAVGGDALSETAAAPTAELIGVAVAFIVLLITFGSLVAAGMPLLTAILGVGIGLTGITTLTGFVAAGLGHPGPRHHARAGRRHRLRAVHHVALPARSQERSPTGGSRRASRSAPRALRWSSPA